MLEALNTARSSIYEVNCGYDGFAKTYQLFYQNESNRQASKEYIIAILGSLDTEFKEQVESCGVDWYEKGNKKSEKDFVDNLLSFLEKEKTGS